MTNKMLNILARGLLGVGFGGLSATVGMNWFSKSLPIFDAQCSSWEYASNKHQRFCKKHLLDAFQGLMACSVDRNEILKLSRADWNNYIKTIANFQDPNSSIFTPDQYPVTYQNMGKLTMITQRTAEFCAPYQTMEESELDKHEARYKRNARYAASGPSLCNIVFHPNKCEAVHAVWQPILQSYDIYIMDQVYALIGIGKYRIGNVEYRLPNHFEGHLSPRPDDPPIEEFGVDQDSEEKMEARFQRAEEFQKWLMRWHTCIRAL